MASGKQVDKDFTVFDTVQQLFKENNIAELKIFLNDQYPQDIAEVIENLDNVQKLDCFNLLEESSNSVVFAELSLETQLQLLKALGLPQIAKIISEMDVDDATDLIVHLPEDEKANILKILPDPIQLAHVKELIHYPSDSAAGIMSTDFLKLRSDISINIAFNYVRRQASEYKAQIYYLYVVDNENKLVGVISLRNLICAPPGDIVANHMSPEVITCKVDDDQETVAKTISKYDLILLPVVDENDCLKGIVTIDDVVDILKTETTQDIYQGSGIGVTKVFPTDELIIGKVSYAARARLPWLLITLLGQTMAAFLIASFDKTIASIPIAISFMPLLSGLSGNIGGQTATIMVRGLVTNDIELKNTWKYLLHELKLGIVLGMICSIITGLIAWKLHNLPILGLVVAIALTISMILGVLLGTIFPMLLQYFKKDPAAASSPVITTILDILTFYIYLTIISVSIDYLR